MVEPFDIRIWKRKLEVLREQLENYRAPFLEASKNVSFEEEYIYIRFKTKVGAIENFEERLNAELDRVKLIIDSPLYLAHIQLDKAELAFYSKQHDIEKHLELYQTLP